MAAKLIEMSICMFLFLVPLALSLFGGSSAKANHDSTNSGIHGRTATSSAHESSSSSSSSSISSSSANQVNVNTELMKTMRFLTTGWVALPQVLPEMQSPIFRDRVLIAEAKARLAYVNFSYDRLRNIDSRLNVPEICGIKGLHTVSAYELDIRGGQSESDARDMAQRLASEEVDKLRACSDAVRQHSNAEGLGHRADAFQLPYMQSINVHRLDDKINALATSRKLGRLAAMLLQEPEVSLYQSTVFLMGEGSSANTGTNWHRDLNMVPLDVAHHGHVTFWCPLQKLEVSRRDSLLLFAQGSHRDVSYLHWYPANAGSVDAKSVIEARYDLGRLNSMDIGDCTAHHGWIWHAAPPQEAGQRAALAFSYVSSHSRVLPDLTGSSTRPHRPFATEDALGYRDWIGDVGDNEEILGHPLLPTVHSSASKATGHTSSSNSGARKPNSEL